MAPDPTASARKPGSPHHIPNRKRQPTLAAGAAPTQPRRMAMTATKTDMLKLTIGIALTKPLP